MSGVRHKCFISYDHADQDEVDDFVSKFDNEMNVIIAHGFSQEMPQEIINCNNPMYVMTRIRELYLKDSTVTIVLMGKCTWAKRYVDWEIQASLLHGQDIMPYGLLGIKLPSYPEENGQFPSRLKQNLKQADDQDDCYARWINYPSRRDPLTIAIDAAYDRRTTHDIWIDNPHERFLHNRPCS